MLAKIYGYETINFHIFKNKSQLLKALFYKNKKKGGGNVRMDGITAKSKDKVGTSLAIPIFDQHRDSQRLASTWQMMR